MFIQMNWRPYMAGGARFDALFSDVADATPTDRVFHARDLIGQCPTIQHLAERTQREILVAFIKSTATLPPDADRIVRAGGRVYRWEFAPRR